MKKFFTLMLVSLLSAGLFMQHADAKRIGGGSSVGKQRSTVTQQAPAKAAPAPSAPAPAAPVPSGASRWLGPLAGLAAGGLLASMFMGNGLGGLAGSMGSILMVLALVVGGVFLFRMIRNRSQAPVAAPMQYNNPVYDAPAAIQPSPFNYGSGAAAMQPAAAPVITYPPGFDAEAFLHHAKVNFIRLQAANDRGDLADISEFTTPEMFAEISMQLKERGTAPQTTEVVTLNAAIAEIVTEGQMALVSVRFSGLIREQVGANAEPFDEAWNLQKPLNDSTGWQVAGIQQLN